jgi:surfactin synthase thioesterase subunit
MAAGTASWCIVPVPNGRARLRLFCVPYAGGGASCYRGWAQALGDRSIEVRAVQLPGRENRLREAPFRDMPSLVEALADGLTAAVDRPYALFGHSLGAAVAFELARVLRARGVPEPVHLFASGANAPQVPRTEEPLHGLPDDEFVRAVSDRYQGIPWEVLEQPELCALVLPALRADIMIVESYEHRPGPPLTCGITALAGRDDVHVAPAKIEPWRALTLGRFACEFFDGDHFFLARQRQQVMSVIRSQLGVAVG